MYMFIFIKYINDHRCIVIKIVDRDFFPVLSIDLAATRLIPKYILILNNYIKIMAIDFLFYLDIGLTLSILDIVTYFCYYCVCVYMFVMSKS